jgi:hypothetical protein
VNLNFGLSRSFRPVGYYESNGAIIPHPFSTKLLRFGHSVSGTTPLVPLVVKTIGDRKKQVREGIRGFGILKLFIIKIMMPMGHGPKLTKIILMNPYNSIPIHNIMMYLCIMEVICGWVSDFILVYFGF